MVKHKSREKLSNRQSVGWDAAIEDAKKRILKLRRTIQVFETQRDAGEPWPGQVQDLDRKRHANG
jgi:hypothetical protein